MRIHSALSAVVFAVALSTIPTASQTPAKRPMTFEDMMKMRRLGDTDVSPDGKWLVYSVTDVDLAKNTKTATLWIQAVAGGEAKLLEGTQPGDGGARFSADGKHLLFLSSRNGDQHIFTADFDPATGATSNIKSPADNLKNPKTNVRSQENNVGSPKISVPDADNAIWSPDGQSIVFTSAVYSDCPAITPENSAGYKCTADRDTSQAESKVKARIFDHLLYKHWNAFTGDKRSHLFQLEVASGTIRDLTPNDPHDVPPFSLGGGGGFAFSPDSKELAFTENLDEEPAISTNADIFTLDLTNPAAKSVKVSTSPGGDFSPAYSPDGKYLAWRSQTRAGYESDKFRLALYDRAANSIKYLLPNFDRWVDEFVWESTWTDGTQAILFVSGDKGQAPLYQFNIRTNVLRRLGRISGEWSGIHYAVWRGPNLQGRLTRGYDIVLGNLMTVGKSAEVVAADLTLMNDDNDQIVIRKAGEIAGEAHHIPIYQPLQVTHLNDSELAQLDVPAMESFWFPAADKTKIQGFLIKPPAFDAAKKYPVKFLIHGGPQGAWGDAWSYRWNAELLAANGYVVVMINPRGSTGYGQAFVDGVNGDWGGKPFTDLMLGLDYAEKTYPFIDKSRECALGASYGGYMANWVLGHTNRFKCIVTHDGMFDPESAYGSTEELWFNEWEFKGKPWDYYGKPDSENPYRKWSPAMSAKNFKTPTLVIHSQLDYRLDVSEGYQLFTTLQRLKVPSKMLYFPDEGHWVQKPQNSELWYKTVNAWVDEWTSPEAKEGKK
jgi:dipeptidyl aminopeptidase/acylaminoacyl peptidase